MSHSQNGFMEYSGTSDLKHNPFWEAVPGLNWLGTELIFPPKE